MFQGGYVLVDDLLDTQPPHIHRVLLEGPHKVIEDSPDPDLGQEAVLGNVFGKGFWNTVQEAVKKRICAYYYLVKALAP